MEGKRTRRPKSEGALERQTRGVTAPIHALETRATTSSSRTSSTSQLMPERTTRARLTTQPSLLSAVERTAKEMEPVPARSEVRATTPSPASQLMADCERTSRARLTIPQPPSAVERMRSPQPPLLSAVERTRSPGPDRTRSRGYDRTRTRGYDTDISWRGGLNKLINQAVHREMQKQKRKRFVSSAQPAASVSPASSVLPTSLAPLPPPVSSFAPSAPPANVSLTLVGSMPPSVGMLGRSPGYVPASAFLGYVPASPASTAGFVLQSGLAQSVPSGYFPVFY